MNFDRHDLRNLLHLVLVASVFYLGEMLLWSGFYWVFVAYLTFRSVILLVALKMSAAALKMVRKNPAVKR